MKLFLKLLAVLTIITQATISCHSKTKEKSEINLGLQTYSFRTMEDQSPLAILNYIKQSGIKNVELMGNHAEPYAGAPEKLMSNEFKRAIQIKQYRKEVLTEEEKVIAEKMVEERILYAKKLEEWRKNVDFKNILSISFSGQMHGATCLNQEGKIIRPSILWNDKQVKFLAQLMSH